ncbi:hypothetical protein BRADI_1g05325v3, partial [Brachypodium distachyon]
MAKMEKTNSSPLHRVIDAGRWDAERLLGRLFVFLHAVLLDSGFTPAPEDPTTGSSSSRLPAQVGATASTLPLSYLAPPLLAAVALKADCARGRDVVLHVHAGADSKRLLWARVDAVAAAALLAGGLDYTARALRTASPVAALWRELADGLRFRVLAELCAGGVTTLMSLPGDAKAEILARLDSGKDLARAAAACRDLRRVVADRDRELWKPLYEAVGTGGWRPLPGLTWKERYLVEKLSIFKWPQSLTDKCCRRLTNLFNSLCDDDDDHPAPSSSASRRLRRCPHSMPRGRPRHGHAMP